MSRRVSGPSRIACAYRDGVLPSEWFQLVRRLRSQAERARLDLTITLVPVSALTDGADVVVVPAALADDARRLARGAEIVALPASGADTALADLVDRLRREASPGLPEPRRSARTVVRRGFQVVPWTSD